MSKRKYLWDAVVSRMKKHPASVVFDNKKSFTYETLIHLAIEHGNKLRLKINQRSKVGVLCRGGLDCAIAVLACWYANLIPIVMSMNYGESHCRKIISLVQPDVLIADNGLDFNLLSFIYDLRAGSFFGESGINGREYVLDDVAIIMCTSGTTGTPKGAMITEDGLIANVDAIIDYFDVQERDTILIARPLYHCAVLTGEFLVALSVGADIFFLDSKFNPAAVIETIKKNDVTVMCGTPTLLHNVALLYKRQREISTLRKVALSGEILSSETAKTIRFSFPETQIYNIYGLTEAGPRVSWLRPELFDSCPKSVGKAIRGVEIRVVASRKDMTELENNKHGHIVVKSSSVMKGYYKNERLTSKTVVAGWLVTGDVGYIDDMGLLYVCSRADDMIIKSGMNIYPQEIENEINKVDGIKDVMVFGIRNDVSQEIAVHVVLNEGNNKMSKREIAAKIAHGLPSYLIPTKIEIVDEISRNASGKKIRPRND